MQSLDNKARAERVFATLTRLRNVSDLFTVEQDLATLARGDAFSERTDQGNERRDAFLAIQALRQSLGMAPADVQTRWDDAIVKARAWASSFN